MRAWPGEQFTIELSGKDQFSQPTVANARFYFDNPALVKINNIAGVQITFFVHMQDMLVRFSPQLVVIGRGQNMTLNNVFQLTYSVFSGDALTTDMPIGNVTIDEPTLNTLVLIII